MSIRSIRSASAADTNGPSTSPNRAGSRTEFGTDAIMGGAGVRAAAGAPGVGATTAGAAIAGATVAGGAVGAANGAGGSTADSRGAAGAAGAGSGLMNGRTVGGA